MRIAGGGAVGCEPGGAAAEVDEAVNFCFAFVEEVRGYEYLVVILVFPIC